MESLWDDFSVAGGDVKAENSATSPLHNGNRYVRVRGRNGGEA